MNLLEVSVLVACLFLLSQVVALPLGATLGKRVSGFRWLLIATCLAFVGYYVLLVLAGKV